MSKEMRFLVFAIEYYRQAKGLTVRRWRLSFAKKDSRNMCWTITFSTT